MKVRTIKKAYPTLRGNETSRDKSNRGTDGSLPVSRKAENALLWNGGTASRGTGHPAAHFQLTEHEQNTLAPAVLALIQERHVGAANAITAAEIASGIGLHGARCAGKVRLIVALLNACGYPIAAQFRSPPGFFWVNDEREATAYLGDLRGRAVAIWRRYRDFSRAAEMIFGMQVEQLRLDF